MKSIKQIIVLAVLAVGSRAAFPQTTTGTAFAIGPELLVTNSHVIAECAAISVMSAEGRRQASVAAADAEVDLAVLRVRGLRGPAARLRTSGAVRLGESVMLFGFPLAGALSSQGNFTSGLVSALRGLGDTAGSLQITAPVQPGNSGGPVLDASGLVIGVVEGKLSALWAVKNMGDIPQNVNFAISLDVLVDFLVRNRIPFRAQASSTARLEPSGVAALAQTFTYRVECQPQSQVALASPKAAPPTAKPKPTVPEVTAVLPVDRNSEILCGLTTGLGKMGFYWPGSL